MSTTVYRQDPESIDLNNIRSNACTNFLKYTWKIITCLFSHITLVTLVVSYCVCGGYMFSSLEGEHEKEIKKTITAIRSNTCEHIWHLAAAANVLHDDEFMVNASAFLKDFEEALLIQMTKNGWDGEESIEKVQWSFGGALFYSIIVITTIGYGHIAPKTPMGKVVTIFYAILGIPLMLLCLSNIGDIMATSFRFLYWRICCYVCTKKPKRRHHSRSRSRSENPRSRPASFRRSLKRSVDSGFGLPEISVLSHSDTELHYHNDNVPTKSRWQQSRNHLNRQHPNLTIHQSLDRKQFLQDYEMNNIQLGRTPVLCNRWVIGKDDAIANDNNTWRTKQRRAMSMPRNQHYLEPPKIERIDIMNEIDENYGRRRRRRIKQQQQRKKSPSASYQPSPKMMTPLGYGHRSKYLDDPSSDGDDDDDQSNSNINMPYNRHDGIYPYDYETDEITRERIRPVPIWLCVLLVISYILAGACLFKNWEGWDFLDAAYFCFITLTTIGFGDLVPAKNLSQKDDEEATQSIALCSLYLLFGIALLAMSFNLVQEEVISNVKSVAKSLGIIKKEYNDSDDEDDW